MTAGVMHYPPRLDQPGDLVQRGRVSQCRARKPSEPATEGGYLNRHKAGAALEFGQFRSRFGHLAGENARPWS